MRGVDGNFLKMQGEMLTRMQVAYQAEQVAQQVRAQTQGFEALRQLREEVGVATRSDAQNQPPRVDEREEGNPPGGEKRDKSQRQSHYGPEGQTEIEGESHPDVGRHGHVDLRI